MAPFPRLDVGLFAAFSVFSVFLAQGFCQENAGVAQSAPATQKAAPKAANSTQKEIDKLIEEVDRAIDDKARNVLSAKIVAISQEEAPFLLSWYPALEGYKQVVVAQSLLRMKNEKIADLMLATLKLKGLQTQDEIMVFLARLKVTAALDSYLQLLPKAKDDTRQTLYYCLTYYIDPRCLDLLMEGFFSDNENIRLYSRTALEKLLPAYALKPPENDKQWARKMDDLTKKLIQEIKKSPSGPDNTRMIYIMELLSYTGRENAAAALSKLLSDNSLGVRASALEDMRNLGELAKFHSKDILKLLADSESLARLEAVKTVVQLDIKEAVPFLAPMLKTDDLRERNAVLSALRRLTGQEIGPYPEAWMRWYEKSQAE